MSKMYEQIDSWYKSTPQLWNIDRVWNAVGKLITQEEYFEITGFVFPSKETISE